MSTLANHNFKRGFKTWAEKKAVEYRRILGLHVHSPLPGRDLAAYLKVVVLHPTDISKLPLNDLCHIIHEYHEFWSAMAFNAGDFHVIIANEKHSLARHESNLMHELAHVICNHPLTKIGKASDLEVFGREYNKEVEKEAEWLGGCLQLPRDAILWALKRGMSKEDIANYFSCSEQMANFRTNASGAYRQFERIKIYYANSVN